MLTYLHCRDCVCYRPLAGSPGHGQCQRTGAWLAVVPGHGCWSGEKMMKCTPNERIEGVDEPRAEEVAP